MAGQGFMLRFAISSLFIHFILPAAAVSVNITVDDTFGNSDRTVIPTYLPANNTWHVGSPSEQCDICVIKPFMLDTSQIVDQSWHHAMYFVGTPIEVQVAFPGTAVYVYNVITNTLPGGAAMTVNISFALDNETVGHFFHAPDSSSDILYNQLVYANASLSDKLHTLVMSASGSDASLIFFDYLLYTTDSEVEGTPSATATVTSSDASSLSATPPSSYVSSSALTTHAVPPSSHPPTAMIVGGVVGGVVLLLVGAVLFFLVSYRLRRHRHNLQASPLRVTIKECSESGFTPPEATAPSIAISEPSFRPPTRSPSLLRSPPVASPPNNPLRPFELKREAEPRHRIEALRPAGSETNTMPSSQYRQDSEAEQGVESGMSERLSSGAVHELQGEIAALRDVLSAITATARGRFDQPMNDDVLPGYEEASRGHSM
ncbi:hypothetical protein GSI_11225 [Ganoderma sinense ZZ0214-1]|uniref:Mid2 domain-containing protein n=1 Tax=Ganoderma sinense ZZ0214-1 TaxID=1077348 RepID=A0A2G8RZG0_9APHY|nr:hypothetical protein GSI_11225 [Ganoderma sinense ZZ0214-1]